MIKYSPKQGENLHIWILQESRNLLIEGHSEDRTIGLLLEATKDSGRTTQNPEIEITNAVQGAVAWLVANPNARIRRGKGWVRSRKAEPTNFYFKDPFWRQDSRLEFLNRNHRYRKLVLLDNGIECGKLGDGIGDFKYWDLFASLNFLICACVRVDRPEVKSLKRWISLGMWTQQFIVPNYCLGEKLNKCDLNMGKSLYQVIEFDRDRIENQWKLLWKLAEELPLAMIVYSGNKSLHGWFPCFYLGRREIKSFVRLATMLGADPMLRIPVQYVRMPGGRNRTTWKKQEVIYYDKQLVDEHNEIVRKRCSV